VKVEELAQVAAELESSLPGRVQDAIRDGVRTEAAPVARQLAEVRGLAGQTIRRLESLENDLIAERHARIDDLALLVDLISSGWSGIDVRLARMERTLDTGGSAQIYRLDERDGLYLTGTSEVALAALHMGEIVDKLPLRYAGYSTNFRREAGAAGKDTRGMFRVHQFNKVEMFVFTRPDESRAEHERMIALEEQFLQALGLPYRAVDVAAGDLGASAVRKVDLEAWFPSQGRYREVTSCSNTTDFQARRLGIRRRSPDGLAPPHTLNGTVVTDRAVLAILETFQGAVPEPLQEYGAPPRIGD